MSILDLFRPKMTRYERDGRWVEVGKLRHVFFNEQPCYEVDGRGDMDFYFASDNEPLYIEERPDGWTVGYTPRDADFASYAQALVALGEWR